MGSGRSFSSKHGCDEVYESGVRDNGVYVISTGRQSVEVYCQFNLDGHHWMVSANLNATDSQKRNAKSTITVLLGHPKI